MTLTRPFIYTRAGLLLALMSLLWACSPAATPTPGPEATLPPPTIGVDCTDPNGNGHTEAAGNAGLTFTFVDPDAVASWSGPVAQVVTTGYIESTTAARGVMLVDTSLALRRRRTAARRRPVRTSVW